MKRYGRSASVVTHGFSVIPGCGQCVGNVAAQACGGWLNNRAENPPAAYFISNSPEK